ncbi:MAG: PA14 domain-containing protein, partial [Verrucomicrobiota bacterium]
QWQNAIDLGQLSEGPFTLSLNGLFFGVRYYFTTFASNQVGSAWAPMSTEFKTPLPGSQGGNGIHVRVYDSTFGAANIDPITNLMSVAEDGSYMFFGDIDYGGFGDLQADYPALTAGSSYSVLWEGRLIIDTPGFYTFGTSSDDGSMFYIDLNDDGDFADGGETIVDNNGDHGNQSRTGSVNLPAGCFRWVTAFYENGGGESMEARWAFGNGLPYGSLNFINGSSNEFQQACPGAQLEIFNAGQTNITGISADLMATGGFPSAAFDVLVYYGPTDGGTNPAGWANVHHAGSYTNLTNLNIGTTLLGLTPSTSYFYTFAATNCGLALWAQPSLTFMTDTNSVDTDGDG